jgi:hypothetical protein
MGYADVSICDMLAHLLNMYSSDISAEDIQANHDSLAADCWDPDSFMELLFKRIRPKNHKEICHRLTDAAAINQTLISPLSALTKVFGTACEKWRNMDDSTKTLVPPLFQAHFKARIKSATQLTAQTVGYHHSHATTSILIKKEI